MNAPAVDWSITGSENAPCPSDLCLGSGTAQVTDAFISTNQFGYNVDVITASGLNVGISGGVLNWLNLQNAVVPSGDPVYWDENSGAGCGGTMCPSSASESAVGTIPGEAFTIGGDSLGIRPGPNHCRNSGTAEAWVITFNCFRRVVREKSSSAAVRA